MHGRLRYVCFYARKIFQIAQRLYLYHIDMGMFAIICVDCVVCAAHFGRSHIASFHLFLLICILFARFLCVIHLQRVSNPTRALVHFLNLFQYASVYVRVCVCVSRCEWTFIRAQCKITMSYIICI